MILKNIEIAKLYFPCSSLSLVSIKHQLMCDYRFYTIVKMIYFRQEGLYCAQKRFARKVVIIYSQHCKGTKACVLLFIKCLLDFTLFEDGNSNMKSDFRHVNCKCLIIAIEKSKNQFVLFSFFFQDKLTWLCTWIN